MLNSELRLARCPRARPSVAASALCHRLARLAHSLAPGARLAPRSRISSTTPPARRHGNGPRRRSQTRRRRRRRRRPRRRPRPPFPRDGLRRSTPRRGKSTTCTWRAAPRHGNFPRTREVLLPMTSLHVASGAPRVRVRGTPQSHTHTVDVPATRQPGIGSHACGARGRLPLVPRGRPPLVRGSSRAFHGQTVADLGCREVSRTRADTVHRFHCYSCDARGSCPREVVRAARCSRLHVPRVMFSHCRHSGESDLDAVSDRRIRRDAVSDRRIRRRVRETAIRQ